MMRQYKGNLVSASQSSLDDITCKLTQKQYLIQNLFCYEKPKKKLLSLSLIDLSVCFVWPPQNRKKKLLLAAEA